VTLCRQLVEVRVPGSARDVWLLECQAQKGHATWHIIEPVPFADLIPDEVIKFARGVVFLVDGKRRKKGGRR